MSGNKTVQNSANVSKFLADVSDQKRRQDTEAVMELMQKATGWKPAMWGTSIIGFGSYAYQYDSGRKGDFMVVGVSPRKTALTLYIMPGFSEYEDLLGRLGPHKTGKSCLYIKRIEDIDLTVLEDMITASVNTMKQRYECTPS